MCNRCEGCDVEEIALICSPDNGGRSAEEKGDEQEVSSRCLVRSC